MVRINSNAWVGRLLGRMILYGVLGALLCAMSGAVLGAPFGAAINLELGDTTSYDGDPPPQSSRFVTEGIELGGGVGAVLGFLQGLILFVVGAGLSSPRERGLAYPRGIFWYLMWAVPAGQAAGVCLSAVGFSMLFLGGGFVLGQPHSEVVESMVVNLWWSAPLGLVVGGIMGGAAGIHRGRAWRREETERTMEHSGA